MKIKRIDTPPEFQPHTISITFETKQEKDDVQELLNAYIDSKKPVTPVIYISKIKLAEWCQIHPIEGCGGVIASCYGSIPNCAIINEDAVPLAHRKELGGGSWAVNRVFIPNIELV